MKLIRFAMFSTMAMAVLMSVLMIFSPYATQLTLMFICALLFCTQMILIAIQWAGMRYTVRVIDINSHYPTEVKRM